MAMVTAPRPPAAAAPAAFRNPRPRRDREAFRAGFAIAIVLHAVLFLTISFSIDVTPRRAGVPLRSYRIDPSLRALDIDIVAEPDAPVLLPPRVEVPTTAPPPVTSLQAPPTPVESAGEPAEPAPAAPTPLERLSRGYGNPELFGEVGPLPLEELSERDILRLRLENLLGIYNDSLAALAAARTRATDWTVRDATGNRWGISPGKIHLGKITLPLPFGFSAPPGRREEVAAKVRSWYESQAQSSRVEAEQTFEERVKAIRERQKAQRDSIRRGGGQ